MKWSEFIQKQFDKLLLLVILLVFLSLALFIFRYFSSDNGMILWVTGLVTGAMSALGLLITGNASKQSATQPTIIDDKK